MGKMDLFSGVNKMGIWGNSRKGLSSRDTGNAVGIWRREGWHPARSGQYVFGKVIAYSRICSMLLVVVVMGMLFDWLTSEKRLQE